MAPYAPYQIELLGKLCVHHSGRTISRFRTYKTGAVLANLAYHTPQSFTRDQLADLFWPDEAPSDARQSLSQSLSSLRRQFEPPGTAPGTFLQATRFTVGLNASSIHTDVAEFEAAMREAEHAATPEERIAPLLQAIRLYGGELLPGYYEEWVIREQQRLAERFFQAVHRLVPLLHQQGERDNALEILQLAVNRDPYREETQLLLIRHLAACGRMEAAKRQYRFYERLLREGLDETPGPAVQWTLEEIKRSLPAETPSPIRKFEPTVSERSGVLATQDPKESRPSPPFNGVFPLPVSRRRGNLPAPLNRFYGREGEIQLIKDLLQKENRRLVTLVGPGGSGKTRMALEIAGLLGDSYVGGIWVVSLAGLEDPARIPEAVAAALELQVPRGGSLGSLLTEALSRSPILLVLDNFEHLLEGSSLIKEWLEQIPHLSCLVTSRRALDLEGESVFPVPPLPVPESGLNPEEVLKNSSVRLFVDRAQSVRPDFQATPGNSALLVDLCRRLEGLPLAVELAAARVQAISLTQILQQLDHRFDFLVSRKRDVSGRHRTLRATLEWSIRLLPPEGQTLLHRLSVFRGGWTLETAEAVCAVPGTLECLEILCENSLIQSEEGAGALRFRMLETIRELAEERLSMEERIALQHRHADFFLTLAQESASLLNGPHQCEGLNRFEGELENLRAALRWYVSQENLEKGCRLTVSLCPFWLERGYITEGRHWFRELLSRPPALSGHGLLAQAQNGAGLLALWQGDYTEAESLLQAALQGAKMAGDDRERAYALVHLGLSAFNRCDYPRAERYYLDGLALFQEEGDVSGEALSHSRLAGYFRIRGEHSQAIHHCRLALELYQKREDRTGESSVLNALGVLHTRIGRYREARIHLEDALLIKREAGDKLGISIVLQNLAISLQSGGNDAEACTLYEESLRLRRELGDRGGVVNVLFSYGISLMSISEYASARRCFLEGLALQRDLGHRGGLEGYAGLLAREGEYEKAARFFAAEEANRQAMGTPLPPDEVATHEQYLDLLKDRLGTENFERAWKEGYGFAWDVAADQALGRAGKEA